MLLWKKDLDFQLKALQHFETVKVFSVCYVVGIDERGCRIFHGDLIRIIVREKRSCTLFICRLAAASIWKKSVLHEWLLHWKEYLALFWNAGNCSSKCWQYFFFMWPLHCASLHTTLMQYTTHGLQKLEQKKLSQSIYFFSIAISRFFPSLLISFWPPPLHKTTVENQQAIMYDTICWKIWSKHSSFWSNGNEDGLKKMLL